MAAYSLDLRKRVLRAWDGGMDAESVAAKYEVSRAWVHRLVQRRRETRSIAPRKQTKFPRRAFARHEPALVPLPPRPPPRAPLCASGPPPAHPGALPAWVAGCS